MFDAREERAPATKSSTIGLGIMLLLGGFVLNHIFSRKSLGPRLGVATTTASLFITLSGVVLGVIGLTSLPFYRALRVAFLVSMAVSILYLPSYLGIQFIQTGADRLGECPGLGQAAANSQVIPQSLSRPENPAVGCGVERRGMFLSYYNTLSVYGVTEAAAQQRVLDNITEYYRREHTHPVRVVFCERRTGPRGSKRTGVTFGSRGPEKLIRVAYIG